MAQDALSNYQPHLVQYPSYYSGGAPQQGVGGFQAPLGLVAAPPPPAAPVVVVQEVGPGPELSAAATAALAIVEHPR